MAKINSILVVILFGVVSTLIVDTTRKEIDTNKRVVDNTSKMYMLVEELCIRDIDQGIKNSEHCMLMDVIEERMSGGVK